jgi:hypothetical protein
LSAPNLIPDSALLLPSTSQLTSTSTAAAKAMPSPGCKPLPTVYP